MFDTPEQQALHVTIAEEFAATLTYLKASPLTTVYACFAVFTLACDAVGADYLRTFMDILEANPNLPGSSRVIRKEPPHRNTDPHTDGVDTSGK